MSNGGDNKFCVQCGRELIRTSVDHESRLACSDESCGFVLWDNPVPVVAGIVEHEDNVILIQNKGWPSSWWGPVTGFLERGETAEDGIVREVSEELGLRAEVQSLVGIYSFFRMNQVIIAYHLIAHGDIIQGEELAAYKPVPIAKLKGWDSATGQAVGDWLASRQD